MTGIHPEFALHGSFEHLKLGRLPKRDDPKTLMLANYLDVAALPPIPPVFDITAPVHSWPMYGNNRISDCTIAAAGHMIEAWTHAAGKFRVPSEVTIEHAYWATGDGTDDGRNELDVLNYWRHHGIGIDKISEYVFVDPRNHQHMQAAMYLFGGVYTGIDLPATAQTQSRWAVVGDGKHGSSAPGSWGGHAVPFLGYDPHGVRLVTWGYTMWADWAFNDDYTEEAYAILSPDWLNAAGKTLQGFDLAALKADLAAIGH